MAAAELDKLHMELADQARFVIQALCLHGSLGQPMLLHCNTLLADVAMTKPCVLSPCADFMSDMHLMLKQVVSDRMCYILAQM